MKTGEVKYLGAPIQMAKIAEGKVWMLNIPATKFEELKNNYLVIHHLRDGENIRIRCLSDKAPSAEARQVNANLEDAYLYLLTEKT
jgi:hypothetical protein